MNQVLTLAVVAVLASGTTAVATTFLLRPSEPAPSTDLGPLETRIAGLQKEVESLRARPTVDVVEAASAGFPRREAVGPTDEQLDAALARWFAARGDAKQAVAPAAGGADVASSRKALRGKADYWSNTELYKQLFDQGRMQELIDEFAAVAAASPNDPQAQMDLGNAYLAWLQMDQSKWQLSMKADTAFDKVLELDGQHWEARFTKAMSYTFWPDFLGKKKEAISHFETLVAQQERMPAQAHEANTYVFLGNLLEQRGDAQRAREIWEKGLRRHPEDAELRKRLGR